MIILATEFSNPAANIKFLINDLYYFSVNILAENHFRSHSGYIYPKQKTQTTYDNVCLSYPLYYIDIMFLFSCQAPASIFIINEFLKAGELFDFGNGNG